MENNPYYPILQINFASLKMLCKVPILVANLQLKIGFYIFLLFKMILVDFQISSWLEWSVSGCS